MAMKSSRECGPLPKLPVASETRESGLLPKLPGDCRPGESGLLPKLPRDFQAEKCADQFPGSVEPDKGGKDMNMTISPTVPWTHPCLGGDFVSDGSARHCVDSSDIGVCSIVGPAGNCAWGAADSLLALDSNQFLNLLIPCIADFPQLVSLQKQFVRSTDRMQLLGKHHELWADDEIRFHLYCLQQAFIRQPTGAPDQGILFIDPLIASAWIQERAFPCEQWASKHPEVAALGLQVVMVIRVHKHWIPVQCVPNGKHVNVFTWDAPDNSHQELNGVIEKLVGAWGFGSFLIHRQQRMFFSSRLCGALAIHYVQHVLFGTLLPTTQNEALASHAKLRERFVECLSQAEVVMRPWIWGHGDDEESEKEWPSHPFTPQGTGSVVHASDPPNVYDSNRMNSSHMCISLDDRLDLMAAHGRDLADDEIRFHLNVLVDRYNEGRMTATRFQPFVMAFDCLNFWNWDDVGHILTERWCTAFPQVRAESQQIVTVMLTDDHWIPFWLVPGEEFWLPTPSMIGLIGILLRE